MSRPFPAKAEEVGSYRAVPGAYQDLPLQLLMPVLYLGVLRRLQRYR